MQKEDLTKEEKIRVYARCKYRGIHMLNLRGEDLSKFISECMSEEIDANRQRPLTKSERLQRAKKLITKYKRREKKPRKHVIIYQNVTPSKSDGVLQDFFINPSQVQDPKKAEFDSWMDEKEGSASYEEIMKQLGSEVKPTHHSENESFFDEKTQFGLEIQGELGMHIHSESLIGDVKRSALSNINTPRELAEAKLNFQQNKREIIKKLKEMEQK